MEDILLLQTIERYLQGEMSPAEVAEFEQLRKDTPEIDQMVVEHRLFLLHMNHFSDTRELKHTLHEVHERLVNEGAINDNEGNFAKTGKVVKLWHRYRKVTAIAASIAGLTALLMTGLITLLAPNNTDLRLQKLGQDIEQIKRNQQYQTNKLIQVESKIPKGAELKGGGSAFLVDGKGYLITNAHVLNGAKTIVVKNKEKEYIAVVQHIDNTNDLALLKIKDSDFKPLTNLPYSIRKGKVDLGEEIFTLGYPKNEIVYNMGYLSAKNGFEGDTTNYQISLSANPGNSGGPVFNKNGEVVGILSSKETKAEGMVFAIKSKRIFSFIDDLKKEDTTVSKVKIPTTSNTIRGMQRTEQIKQIEDCVFQVSAYN